MEDESSESKCQEFKSLQERSQEYFSILRDIPRFGLRHWQSQFMKTFDIFTKLWRFQQENRAVLQKELNLKRHEIGEIASKIGQLYYHYYLHTSDLKYLHEAMDFYSAILNRGYFKSRGGEIDLVLRIKSLRYLARYFVVAQLLKDFVSAEKILETLKAEVTDLPAEAANEKEDWNLVIKEGINFLDAENQLAVNSESFGTIRTQLRLTVDDYVPVNESGLRLNTAVIIGDCEKQIKFSELTIDMFRMIQLLEYLPEQMNLRDKDKSATHSLPNPSKHLLYKPSFGQINAFLSAVFKDLSDASVLLLYISGGDSNYEQNKTHSLHKNIEKYDTRKFYPQDIAPFTRKPMFIIVDSSDSFIYQSIPSLFDEPRICLTSPLKLPDHVANRKHGSLFTLFLLQPLLGICCLCDLHNMTEKCWNDSKVLVDKIGQLAIDMLLSESVDSKDSFAKLLQDSFLRNIISHFFICFFVFRLYKKSQGNVFLPLCSPRIPQHILEHKVLHRYLLDMLSLIGQRHLFFEHSQLPQLDSMQNV